MEDRTIRGGKKGQQTAQKNRINEDITAKEVRLIGIDGEQAGIVSLKEAQAIADDAGVDLVEISPNAEPPVCKVMDYGKFIFEKSKELKEQKKKQKQIQVKEIKFRPGTDEGDYQVKLRNLRKFLEAGDKAKITVRFRGREIAHHELGIQMLKRLEEDLADYGEVEQQSKFEGRQMIMVLSPKKKKK